MSGMCWFSRAGGAMRVEEEDYLTGLPTRRGFVRCFSQLPADSRVTIFYIDLDNFKTVNDVYGHNVGDNVLRSVSRLFVNQPDIAFAARMGGDEFALVSTTILQRAQAEHLMDGLFASIRSPQEADEAFGVITISAGILLDTPVQTELEALLRRGDAAMYEAKRQGKNCYVFYEDVEARVRVEHEMIEEVVSALDEERFEMMMQPVLDIATGKAVQTEVHFVWQFRDGKNYYARQFRTVMERNGFIRTLDLRLFEQLCRAIARNRELVEGMPRFSLIISAQSLLDDKICEILMDIVSRYGLSPELFDCAVYETIFGRREVQTIIERTHELADLGFSITLCAFGETFYSTKYLRELPLGILKIYPEYYKKLLAGDVKDRGLLRLIIESMASLGTYVSCGELDDAELIPVLQDMGCSGCEGPAVVPPTTLADYKERLALGQKRLASFVLR